MHCVSFSDTDDTCELHERFVQHSKLISHLITHCFDDRPIPLINVTRQTFEHIDALLSRTVDVITYTDDGILFNDRLIPLENEFHVTNDAKACIQSQVQVHKDFLQSLDKQTLLDMAHAAMYLNMPYVRDVICMHLANTFEQMSVVDIKAFISE